jgi:ATP synthase protein I
MLRIHSAPFRTVLWWQVIVTASIAALVGVVAGWHGAVSSALGGCVALVACLGFAVVTQFAKQPSIGATLITAFRAEGVKVGLSIALLWLVLANYRNVVPIAFVGTFAVAILVFSMAVFVRDVGRKA